MAWIVGGAVCTILLIVGAFLYLSRKDLKAKVQSEATASAAVGGLNEAIKSHDAIEEIHREMDDLRDFYGDDSDGLHLPAAGDGPDDAQD